MIINENILIIESLKKSFVHNTINVRGEQEDKRFHIIDDLNLRIPRGKITALVGGNGVGKTTLFNIISGFLPADKGTITLIKNDHAIPLLKLRPEKISQMGTGRMFQDNHIFLEMTVIENMLIADKDTYGEIPFISIFRQAQSKAKEQERIKKAQRIFKDLFGNFNPFWKKKNDLSSSLSHGQQRLLGLARLFMGDYELVLLDEPTAGINPKIIQQVVTIIQQMVTEKGISVFMVEHNMKVVLELADFCCFMNHGKIGAFGTPEEVIGNDEVRRSYLGM